MYCPSDLPTAVPKSRGGKTFMEFFGVEIDTRNGKRLKIIMEVGSVVFPRSPCGLLAVHDLFDPPA